MLLLTLLFQSHAWISFSLGQLEHFEQLVSCELKCPLIRVIMIYIQLKGSGRDMSPLVVGPLDLSASWSQVRVTTALSRGSSAAEWLSILIVQTHTLAGCGVLPVARQHGRGATGRQKSISPKSVLFLSLVHVVLFLVLLMHRHKQRELVYICVAGKHKCNCLAEKRQDGRARQPAKVRWAELLKTAAQCWRASVPHC